MKTQDVGTQINVEVIESSRGDEVETAESDELDSAGDGRAVAEGKKAKNMDINGSSAAEAEETPETDSPFVEKHIATFVELSAQKTDSGSVTGTNGSEMGRMQKRLQILQAARNRDAAMLK